jgi:hypothetical protein
MSVRRHWILWFLAIVIPLVGGERAHAAPCWFPPVTGTVTDPYREPPCPWCAGNRGIDYRVGGDVVVRAAATGRVEFVGAVGGIRYVVVRMTNGWRHTYGQLVSSTKQRGEAVLVGTPIGRASRSFFFGLRIGDDYADPARFIGVLRGRPRLVTIDGTPARRPPAARPMCRPSDERLGRSRSVRSPVSVGVGPR